MCVLANFTGARFLTSVVFFAPRVHPLTEMTMPRVAHLPTLNFPVDIFGPTRSSVATQLGEKFQFRQVDIEKKK